MQEDAEVVAGGGEYGIDAVAIAALEVIAAHTVLGFGMTEAVVEGQQRVPTERNDNRLLDSTVELGCLGSGRQIGDEAALAPFGYGLWIDAVALGQGPQLS